MFCLFQVSFWIHLTWEAGGRIVQVISDLIKNNLKNVLHLMRSRNANLHLLVESSKCLKWICSCFLISSLSFLIILEEELSGVDLVEVCKNIALHCKMNISLPSSALNKFEFWHRAFMYKGWLNVTKQVR